MILKYCTHCGAELIKRTLHERVCYDTVSGERKIQTTARVECPNVTFWTKFSGHDHPVQYGYGGDSFYYEISETNAAK